MIIDKRLNSSCRVWATFINASGVFEDPDTTFKITIYKAGVSAPEAVITAADITKLDVGVYFYVWDLSSVSLGNYTAFFNAVDDSESIGYSQDISVVSSSKIGDYDKALTDKILIFSNFADVDGVLTDADTSATITIYAANNSTPLINGANMTNYGTGKYYYQFSVSAITAQNIAIKFLYTHDSVVYGAFNQALLVDSEQIQADISDTGKPKIFDDNLIIPATATEPTANIGATDLMSYIKNNRHETYITLRPDWNDAAAVEPDGDMDALTDWTDGAGVTSSALDTTYYITGLKSFLITGSEAAAYEMTWAGTANITAARIGWIGLRLKDTPTGTISVKINIDDGTYDYEVEATTDYLGNAINTIETWYYIAVNMQGSADIDYTAITGINIKVINTATEAIDFYIDGLRFTPHIHTFIYTFNKVKTINLAELKNCNSSAYDVSYYDSSYTSLMSGAFDSSIDYALDYDSTGVSATRVKVELNAADYNGALVITLGDIIVLTQLYEWANNPKHFPVTKKEISETSNWLGAKRVFKTRSAFECAINFDAFTADEETDIQYIQTLQDRDTPFFYWLNGNVVNTSINVLTNEWRRENLYRVYNATDSIKTAHENGQNTKANPIEKNSLKFVEAAYIEAI